VASDPIIPKIVSFTLKVGAAAAVEFNTDLLDAAVVPTAGDVQTVRTLDGVSHSDSEGETYSLDLRTIQDWDTSRPGLASYLWTNKGAIATFVLKLYNEAISATAPAFTGTVTLVPIPYGGPGNTFIEAEVSMPCTVDPTIDITP
jgi:hypothetical protein